jgi:rhodanese-related sulfurtransferase
MSVGTDEIVAEKTPAETFQDLSNTPGAALVDVRTRAEWTYVGTADLSGLGKPLLQVEWQSFLDTEVNRNFVVQLMALLGDTPPERLYFICRSGARSMRAARAASAAFAAAGLDIECVNVAEGFEGDLDETGRRGVKNGWKARNLPWRQG